ncbi:MAG TPA: DNRLRE domain-containing protein [Bacillota bacterium]|nr:DNRLRE domain-containing protein [Bacillota bacterium]
MKRKSSWLLILMMISFLLTFIGCSTPNSTSELTAPETSPAVNIVFSAASNNWVATFTPGPDDGKDAMVQSRVPDLNAGNYNRFMAIDWTWSGVPGAIRSLIEFDLSDIPDDASITSALLSLYAWDGSSPHSTLSGSNACWLQRITSSWAEDTVTWNNQPTTTTQNQVTLPASTSPTQNYPDIDVTDMVLDMIADPSAGYGMMIRLQTEAYYRNMSFCSSDHTNSALRPKLVVTFTTP